MFWLLLEDELFVGVKADVSEEDGAWVVVDWLELEDGLDVEGLGEEVGCEEVGRLGAIVCEVGGGLLDWRP